MLEIQSTGPVTAGDVTGDGIVDLSDALTALKVMAGMLPPDVVSHADLNANGRIGLAEAVYSLQRSAGMKYSHIEVPTNPFLCGRLP